MQKLKLFLFILVITPAICALYGIIHDQLTYTISPEYYTKFKFMQFGLLDDHMRLNMNERWGAMIVGIRATWWMGIPIGFMYATIVMFFKNNAAFYQLYFKTIVITFIVTALTSFTGYLYWKFYLQYTNVNWYLPENLQDKNSFICVGCIHNFSYIGGTAGLMAGILYLVIQKGKQTIKKRTTRLQN